MNLSKLRVQKKDLVKRNQPDLFNTINKVFPNVDDDTFGKIAGLAIEYVIQSGGDVDIFGEEIDLLEEDY